jgi:hypothetical protein
MLLSELEANEPEDAVRQLPEEPVEKIELPGSAAGDEVEVVAEQESIEQVIAEPAEELVVMDACHTLGPFRKLDRLRAFTRAIKDYVVDASFRSRDEQEQSMFWV